FSIENKHHAIKHICNDYGIDMQDEMIVLQRVITKNGKSICRVNGKLVTLAILKEFGKLLIDIHSQHETQSLMDVDNHIRLLDMYDKKNIQPAKDEYNNIFIKLTKLKNRYKN